MNHDKQINGAIPQVVRAKVSDIYPNPNNFRKKFDEDEIKTLAADIRQNGITHMPEVRGTGDVKKPFILVAGERRWRAIKLLGWEEISVTLAPADKDEKSLDMAGFTENINRADLTTFEQASGCAYFIEKYKMSTSEVARATGRSITYVNRLVKPFSELHPKVREYWKDGHPLCTVETIGKLVSKFESDQQLDAWKNLTEYGTFEAPEGADVESDDGDGEGTEGNDKKNKETSSGFRLNGRQVMERYGQIRKSIGGKSATAEEVKMFALVQWLVGKRKALPEGIEIEMPEEKKGPSKPVKTRGARSMESASA